MFIDGSFELARTDNMWWNANWGSSSVFSVSK